jgi:hypothetical protein
MQPILVAKYSASYRLRQMENKRTLLPDGGLPCPSLYLTEKEHGFIDTINENQKPDRSEKS